MQYDALRSLLNLLWQHYRVSDEKKRILNYFSEHSGHFPLRVGDELDTNSKIQMALYLCRKYMLDLRSSHCTPLPASMFNVPTDDSTELQINQS
ncbi:Phosphatidylserine lipase ABHD16A [Frankliniella fusca]|uniref:Phosphatidylserine lipase ABHD16A n=1 Tax=Frankliniella fusca TaxID=407009 RepID=A0AAE1I2T1_9NEOP|nr:Phosphatidylserine lipase ABHD16A [Frankliniella fusca]